MPLNPTGQAFLFFFIGAAAYVESLGLIDAY